MSSESSSTMGGGGISVRKGGKKWSIKQRSSKKEGKKRGGSLSLGTPGPKNILLDKTKMGHYAYDKAGLY